MNTVQDTREYLLKYNIKPSMQRMAIMDFLIANRIHPTADEIYNAGIRRFPRCQTTVYTMLKLFTEQGAVKALVIDEKNVRFDIDTTSHAHFMCLGCGCVYDLPIENQEAIQLEGVGELTITEIHSYYKGYCKKCAEGKAEKTYYYYIKKCVMKKFICTVCGFVDEETEALNFVLNANNRRVNSRNWLKLKEL